MLRNSCEDKLLFVLALLACTCGAIGAASSKAASVLACLSNDCTMQATSWQHMLQDKPPCLVARKLWWSSAQPSNQLSVALVTQLSVDRLPQLRAQCSNWMGPLAAAIYLPLLHPDGASQLSAANEKKLAAAQQEVEQLFQLMEVGNGCQLHAALLYELFADEQAVALYPVNSLRNYARLLAHTPMIVNIDVDMIPSLSLSNSLATGTSSGSTSSSSRNSKGVATAPDAAQPYVDGTAARKVYVIPAFETTCGGPAYADSVSVFTKQQLLQVIAKGCLEPFRARVCPACHNATNFSHWFNTTEPYSVVYQETFEPWFISDRSLTPWYDVRFRGYGKNKIVQSAAMHAAGVRFQVHADGFLVHRPHTESKARKQFLHVKFKSRKESKLLQGSLYQHIELLWNQSKADMAQGTYKACTDPVLQQCLQQLEWWQGVVA